MKNTPTALEIEIAEDRLSDYYRANYGPLWGHSEEEASAALEAELVALYDAASIPSDDRIHGL